MTRLRRSAERCFWAVLDAPGWTRTGPLPDGLLAALAEEIPVLDPLHAVGAPLGDRRVLACAVPADALAAVDRDALALTPETLPGFAADLPGAPDPDALNLLCGAFEPVAVRRARRRAHALAAVTVLVCAVLISVGLDRRASAWRIEAADARGAEAALIAAADYEGGDLQAALADLRRAAAASRPGIPDAAADLAAVLAGWPAQASCVTHSIAVGADGAAISATVSGDPAEFLRALRPPRGWTLDEPRLNAAGDATRVALGLRPPPGEEAAP